MKASGHLLVLEVCLDLERKHLKSVSLGHGNLEKQHGGRADYHPKRMSPADACYTGL